MQLQRVGIRYEKFDEIDYYFYMDMLSDNDSQLIKTRPNNIKNFFVMKHRIAVHQSSHSEETGILPNAAGQHLVQQVQSTSIQSATKLANLLELQNGIVPTN
jgi:hypothetical protein